MPGVTQDGGRRVHRIERVGFGLQDGAAALLDLVGAGGQASEEGIDVLADFVRRIIRR